MCFCAHSIRLCLWAEVSIGVERGSAFRYPWLVKYLETVEREMFTPTSSNLAAMGLVVIVGFLRIYCPIAREAFCVILLICPLPHLHFTSFFKVPVYCPKWYL